jgi:hypothetical protein
MDRFRPFSRAGGIDNGQANQGFDRFPLAWSRWKTAKTVKTVERSNGARPISASQASRGR